jgi:hypothetical protein
VRIEAVNWLGNYDRRWLVPDLVGGLAAARNPPHRVRTRLAIGCSVVLYGGIEDQAPHG